MNFLSQIFSIALFNLKTIPNRLGPAISAAFGIAGVVGVLVGVLAIAEGFKKVMTSAGADDVAIVLRAGSDNEMSSGLTKEETKVISDAPGVARNEIGPLTSSELFVIVDLPKRTTGTDANVPLRGLEPAAYDVRGNIKIEQGRRFEPGKNEIIVGAGAAGAFRGLDLGKSIVIGQNTWEIVGIFSADGGVSESEIWTDAAVLQPAYKRGNSFQSVYVRLASAGAYDQFRKHLEQSSGQIKTKTATLSEFYAEQSDMLSSFISGIGVFIAGMMALGALFGALNTMYGAIAARTREIATLRALGFGTWPVIVSVLAESLFLALVGGVIGAAVAYFAFNGMTTSTMNWATFSQVTFAFAVTPALMTQAMIWAAILGLFGGLFPAIRAARLPIASALREI